MTWLRPPGPVASGLRVGLLGGSFNPAHDGHLYVSEVALKRLGLDYVWWLVTPQNPLRTAPGSRRWGRPLATGKGNRAPSAHRRDGYRAGAGHALFHRYAEGAPAPLPGTRLHLADGQRQSRDLPPLARWREIAQRVPIAVVQRPAPCWPRCRPSRCSTLPPGREICVVDGRRNAQSSTALRAGKAR